MIKNNLVCSIYSFNTFKASSLPNCQVFKMADQRHNWDLTCNWVLQREAIKKSSEIDKEVLAAYT